MISVFDSVAARNTPVGLSDASLEPQQFLLGANWLVTVGYEGEAEDLANAQKSLGGILWSPGDPIPMN